LTVTNEDLARQIQQLTARIDGLEAENARLRARALAKTDASPVEPADAAASSRFDRRNLLRLGGAAAAVGAGAMMLRPSPAGATTNTMNFGAENDAGTDSTGLTSSNPNSDTLHVANTSAGGGTSGRAINAHISDAASDAAVIYATQDGTGNGITAEITSSTGGAAVLGLGLNGGGVAGGTAGVGAGALGVTFGDAGPGVLAVGYDDTSTGTALEAVQNGTGTGIYSHIDLTTNSKRAVNATTIGTGPAIVGSVNNGASKAPGVAGTAAGTGPGISGTSTKGVGGLFKGATAQLQLTPSSASTHPAKGSAGQLFVDKSTRLWYCHGGTSWKQLA